MFVDRTNIARFFVCIWTEKQILFWVFHGGGNAKSHQTRVLSQSSSHTASVTPPNSYDTSEESSCQKSVCTLPLGFTKVSNHTYLKMRVSALRVCHPQIVFPNSVISKNFFLHINGLHSRMLFSRIAAVAAAAFEEAGIFPLCGDNGFPMRARKFDLRFNVVRIFRTILVIFHGRLGRVEVLVIEVLFFLAQSFWTVIHHPRIIYQNSAGTSPEHSMLVINVGHVAPFRLCLALTFRKK